MTADTPADRPAELAIVLLREMGSGDRTPEEYDSAADAVAALLSELADLRAAHNNLTEAWQTELKKALAAEDEVEALRAEVERLIAEAREHVTELNLATINSFLAGEQSKEAREVTP